MHDLWRRERCCQWILIHQHHVGAAPETITVSSIAHAWKGNKTAINLTTLYWVMICRTCFFARSNNRKVFQVGPFPTRSRIHHSVYDVFLHPISSAISITNYLGELNIVCGKMDHLFRRKSFVNQFTRKISALLKPLPETGKGQTLRVSELFTSVQGEGPHAGRPSLFLRLGLCNLSCNWCDTPYTWLYTNSVLEKVQKRAAEASASAPSSLFDKNKELVKRTVDDVEHDIVQRASSGVRAVVITGGEPLLHKKPLLTLVPALLDRQFAIEFETNGTLSPVGIPQDVHLNVSPKLSNSLMPRDTRLKFPVLREYMSFPSSILKFVIDNERDIEEVFEIVSRLDVDPERVFLMPQGTVREILHHSI